VISPTDLFSWFIWLSIYFLAFVLYGGDTTVKVEVDLFFPQTKPPILLSNQAHSLPYLTASTICIYSPAFDIPNNNNYFTMKTNVQGDWLKSNMQGHG
jgi:hypothetical protein